MTKQETTTQVIERAQVLAETLTKKLHERWAFSVGREHFEIEKPKANQRFFRIIQVATDTSGSGRSVHAFVEIATGKIVKAAGWKAPAKYSNGELASKYNLLENESFEKALEKCDEHGGWLYK